MTRIKGGKLHAKHRRNILKRTKGYKWGAKSKIKLAKTASRRAGQFAYVGRKLKKRAKRNLWLIKINAACRQQDISYNKLIDALNKKKIKINRKILAELAEKNKAIFNEILKFAFDN